MTAATISEDSTSAYINLPVGWSLIRHIILDSTNLEARRLATNGASTGRVVQAIIQTAGRGRGKRVWHSPAGNLYFSVLLRPRLLLPQDRLALTGFVASVAIIESLITIAPTLTSQLACKWPNDILCGGRKLCGILLEGDGSPDSLAAWVIIGVGLNITCVPIIEQSHYPATSLIAEGVNIVPESLLGMICQKLAIWFDRWQEEGFIPIYKAWLGRAVGIGQSITVQLDHTSISGVFFGLDHDGALLIRTDQGGLYRILAGDILFSQ